MYVKSRRNNYFRSHDWDFPHLSRVRKARSMKTSCWISFMPLAVLAIVVAFIGVLIVLRPNFAEIGFAALLFFE